MYDTLLVALKCKQINSIKTFLEGENKTEKETNTNE